MNVSVMEWCSEMMSAIGRYISITFVLGDGDAQVVISEPRYYCILLLARL